MKNNVRPVFLAISLLAASTAIAQPAAGLPIPSLPSANEIQARVVDVAQKTTRLNTAEVDYESAKLSLIQGRLLQLGIPKLPTSTLEATLQKRAYPGILIGFSAEHGQPQWSYHAIERDIFDICHDREEKFFEDLTLVGAPHLSQYSGSGFQRGHMAPAADFRWSPKASVASNTLTNITPQAASLNEGLWAELEISTRRYLQVRDSVEELLVVTGPVLENGLQKLKDTSRVSIPKKFYKVVVNLKEQHGFAFLVESSAPKADQNKVEPELRKRALSIDSLEKILQIDFFPNFSAAQNKSIEATLNMDEWFAIPGDCAAPAPAPITNPTLLTNAFNTAMITAQNQTSRKAVVGTVTRVLMGQGGGIVLFFDDKTSTNRFQVQIQARDAAKFINPTPLDLLCKVVRAEGTISGDGVRFRMSIRDPKKLIVLR